ncbi:hypothetical protein CERZMDRAFT_92099 [Cercospora zeae-maydis SCOH1-5]|uniref:ubiquitinyl hydrolase 1 n=1 Tax=Cercospora zeae-maydis SCOH1-5 TaxID=717836 RepID=A0A6A6FVP2_9PEZI|nr:hypothetical protein CERZMDRAFT_92099 [Cercospora zeae-maydis SCOH1-5]
MAAASSAEAEVQRVIEHIFLPPKLPQSEDKGSDVALVIIALKALISLRDLVLPGQIPVALTNAIALLDRLREINSLKYGKTEEAALREILISLPVGQTLALKISAQNAGVLISREADILLFEAFELSAANESVLGTKGRLKRTFPGSAVSLSAETFAQQDCASTISTTLSTMSHEKAPGMQPTSRKAGDLHEEERDTTSPAAITELLFGFLKGLEPPNTGTISQITKSTRDEVLWNDAEIPWRRSSMWLLIRVALHLVVCRSSGGSRDLYKEVMAYMMSYILRTTPCLSSELMFTMSAKISRRLKKLSGISPTLPGSVRARVDRVLRETSDQLSARWTVIQERDHRDLQLSALVELDFEADTQVALPQLDKYLEALRSRQRNCASSSFAPASELLHHSSGDLPPLPERNSNDKYYATANLHQFEQWIPQHLDQWLAKPTRDDTCEKLHKLMEAYHILAERHYSQNPEMQSGMVLMLYELWVACDQMAVKICPFLAEFHPDISTVVLENLLLPFRAQMERLIKVEEYLRSRQRKATKEASLLFSMESQGFANQYFTQSDKHQELLMTIEQDATKARKRKIKEYQDVKARYHRLDSLHNEAACEYITKVIDTWCDPPETQRVHALSCRKCALKQQRDALTIQVHEWPIPSELYRARAVVFELQVPSWLAHWRSARQYLLQNVLKGEQYPLRPHTSYILSSNDPHLTKKYLERATHCRVGLLSQTKPCVNTHYKIKNIATSSETTVCPRNGLQYDYYDAATVTGMGPFTFRDTMALACTYKLSRHVLQSSIVRLAACPDGPAPNSVLAKQDNRPADMALDEFKELTSVPIGRHIQWANIMLQLAMPGVDFKKADTTLLLLQCIHQAGPSRGTEVARESHVFLTIGENVESLAATLNEALQRVKENWESAQALRTFIAIAARVLSLATFESARDTCLDFLESARKTALKWVFVLRDKAHTAHDQEERALFISKSVEVALICASTFDVEDEFLEITLRKDASILLQCSIVIQEGEQNRPCSNVKEASLLDMRYMRLLHRSYKTLAQPHLHSHLHHAVNKMWSSYNPGSNFWRIVSSAVDHWLTIETAAGAVSSSMSVHYDLLSGTLLVKGLPLDQPPQRYRAFPLYSTLFRHATVEVLPCMAPGFDFSTKRSFGDGYAVQLGVDANDLLVKAQKDNELFETIPARVLDGFPTHFQHDYVHWLDHSKNIVQFRPKQDPWNPSSSAVWTLSTVRGKQKWRLQRAERSVAGIGSKTSQHLANILEPFAEARRIHNIVQSSSSGDVLHIDIPMLRIGFLLSPRSSVLESREYRSMVVDENQLVGTLVGFKSKIVLKPAGARDLHHGPRMVLVPESSSVSYSRRDEHVTVAVSKAGISKVHALSIDVDLCRLTYSGDIGLYMAYLHALTSFCLIDPLTRKSGTEQSLSIMRSAATHSFDRLSQDHIHLLELLASLSPGREYYPKRLRSMQVVSWDSQLSYLSQHGHFAQAAEDLLQRCCRAAIFLPETQEELKQIVLSLPDRHLLERDNIRSATFRVSTFGAEDFTTGHDVKYQARDRDGGSQRATDAADIAGFFFRSGTERYRAAISKGTLWQTASTLSRVEGPRSLVSPQSLTRYSARLLSAGHEEAMQYLTVLHHWLGSSDARQYRFSIMIWLSTIASQSRLDLDVLQVIAMAFKSPALAQTSIPNAAGFLPKLGWKCEESVVRQIVVSNCKPFWSCPENNLTRQKNERSQAYDYRRQNAWQEKSGSVVNALVAALARQWPCEVPTIPDVGSWETYINISNAMEQIKKMFQAWHDNKRLHDYFTQLELGMASFQYQQLTARSTTRNVIAASDVPTRPGFVSEQDLFSTSPPAFPADCYQVELPSARQQQSSREDQPLLASLVKMLKSDDHSRSRFAKKYADELEDSLNAMKHCGNSGPSITVPETEIIANSRRCKVHIDRVYERLVDAVEAASRPLPRMHTPRISPSAFLQQLSRHRWAQLSPEWRECVVAYGVALTALQRAVRLLKLADPSRLDDLVAELRNTGHTNWNPMQYPESLLIEVENGIMIREVQEQIAGYMRDPPQGNNAVMQLLMGQGKSSVIVPIVSAFLAGSTGDTLCRVLVAKPQSKQMRQMLISKLGGLVNRRVYYMPFSRSLKLDAAGAAAVCELLRECTLNGGILLVQPEHILSFQLMALECFITGREDVGSQLLAADVQSMLSSARDIVDESDENFSVSFELVYTMGLPNAIEFSPDRWILVQQVLDVVSLLAVQLGKALPDAIEHLPNAFAGSFPRIRFLRKEGGNTLLQSLADYICAHGLHGLQIWRQPEAIRKAIRQYITKLDLNADEVAAVENSVFWTEGTSSPLLLLRGFIAGGVLSFIFGQKRWRVNYGLTTTPRTPPTKLAVPYRAKDMPAPRAEFSHPDVVLFLTSLSYYYGGLDDEDLFTALGHVLDSDQADIEFMAWVKDAPTLPIAFRQLQGINLKDRLQCINEVFPCLRFVKSVIDYFLSHVVFPKEIKEFPLKLSASGWDMGKSKKASGGAVTGFSGTNDSKCLLPVDVGHLDLEEQKHTNARVLEHILQPSNGVVLMPPAEDITLSDAERLLKLAMALDQPVQVILDVGAAVLELSNLQVAKTWLKMHDSTKDAAVFVNEDDDICVVDRGGRIELLRTSSYATRLGSCLIFLDEAHTRGIDLELPETYRALLTLGAGLTKDRTTQAAMRMRRLGQGQTIVFCIPQEIQSKICELTSKSEPKSITTSDVLLWTISETHKEISRCMPLWQVQGERFCHQESVWLEHQQNGAMTKNLAERFLENEAQTIEKRYRPRQVQSQPTHLGDSSDARLRLIAQRCEEHDDLNLNASVLQEEQERELSPEIEQQRQVQRPASAEPAKHSIHRDVVAFAKQGLYSSTSPAYMPAFQALHDTSAAHGFPPAQLKKDSKLLVSADFVQTVQRSGPHSYVSDSYQRSVNWLLSTKTPQGDTIDRMLIISPYEANELYPSMSTSKATLHLYKPRGNPGYAPLDRLDFHTVPIQSRPSVPRSLAIQLNLFAGQLYFSSYEDYLETCKFLGLSTRTVSEDMVGWQQDATGFILQDDQGRRGGESGLENSPVNFMKVLMSKIRKNGESIVKTQMGELLEGKLFQHSDFK